MNIVMFNMSYWRDWQTGIVNRNYFIFQELSQRPEIDKILCVDFLPLTIRKAVKQILWAPWVNRIVYWSLTGVCFEISPKQYVYCSIGSFFNHQLVIRDLRKISQQLGFTKIIHWSYNPLITEYIGQLNEQQFVFDTVDDWSEHKGYTEIIPKAHILQNYQTISEKADRIFTVSNELIEFYRQLGRTENVTWIPNGVNIEHFTKSRTKPTIFADITKPIIGYLGTIQERFDFDLVAAVATANPDKIIALCGPIWPSVLDEFTNKLGRFSNIITTGRIGYQDSPAFLQSFSVAIIPHKLDHFIHSTNPMKMYEYLAAGLPVVSTRGAGIEMFASEIRIANNSTQFIYFINEEIHSNSNEKRKLRQAAVEQHTWQSRITQMLNYLQ